MGREYASRENQVLHRSCRPAQYEAHTGDLGRTPHLALYNILGTHDLLHGYFAPIIAEYGISLAGWNVLNLLHSSETGSKPMHALSELMLVSRQNVTQMVDGLEKKKLVQRHACKDDGRVKHVEITKAGRELVERAAPGHFEAIKTVFGVLREPELELFSDYLLRLQERILELRDAAANQKTDKTG